METVKKNSENYYFTLVIHLSTVNEYRVRTKYVNNKTGKKVAEMKFIKNKASFTEIAKK